MIKYVIVLIILFGCGITKRKGGTLPIHMDKYALTTEDRTFELKNNLTGKIVRHQTAYPCEIDSIIYNSTSIVKLVSGDTITLYSPCLTRNYENGSKVIIRPIEYSKEKYFTKREIFIQFPKNSSNYPYYECRSCRHPNTIGNIILAEKDIK